jgi:hypothetical protein
VEAGIKKAGVAARLEDSKNSGPLMVATGARSFLLFHFGFGAEMDAGFELVSTNPTVFTTRLRSAIP